LDGRAATATLPPTAARLAPAHHCLIRSVTHSCIVRRSRTVPGGAIAWATPGPRFRDGYSPSPVHGRGHHPLHLTSAGRELWVRRALESGGMRSGSAPPRPIGEAGRPDPGSGPDTGPSWRRASVPSLDARSHAGSGTAGIASVEGRGGRRSRPRR